VSFTALHLHGFDINPLANRTPRLMLSFLADYPQFFSRHLSERDRSSTVVENWTNSPEVKSLNPTADWHQEKNKELQPGNHYLWTVIWTSYVHYMIIICIVGYLITKITQTLCPSKLFLGYVVVMSLHLLNCECHSQPCTMD